MNDAGETAAARLWRDRAQIREHERDEARAQARIAAEKVAILSAENDRLSTENARLRAQISPDAIERSPKRRRRWKPYGARLRRCFFP